MAEATKTTKDVVWYTPEVSESDLVPEVREILEKYSNVPSDQVPKHVWEVVGSCLSTFHIPRLVVFGTELTYADRENVLGRW